MLKFCVKNQIMVRTDEFLPVSDSKNYLKAEFEFSDEWQGEVVAIFGDADDNFFEVVLEENQCFVPWEVIKAPFFSVSVFCGDLVTSNVVKVAVEKSGFNEGMPSKEPSPDVYNQILNMSKPPYIGENGNWYIWDKEKRMYKDSGNTSKGQKGDTGDMIRLFREPAKIHSLKNSADAEFLDLTLYVGDGESENLSIRVSGNNLFNIDAISGTSSVVNNGDGTLVASEYPSGSGKALKELCPAVKAGDSIVFNFTTTSSIKTVYLSNGVSIQHNRPFLVTESALGAKVSFYCNRVDGVMSPATISDIRATFEGCPSSYTDYIEPREVRLDGVTLLANDRVLVNQKDKTVRILSGENEIDITDTEAGTALLLLRANYKDTVVACDAECSVSYILDLTSAYCELLDKVTALEKAAVNNI